MGPWQVWCNNRKGDKIQSATTKSSLKLALKAVEIENVGMTVEIRIQALKRAPENFFCDACFNTLLTCHELNVS